MSRKECLNHTVPTAQSSFRCFNYIVTMLHHTVYQLYWSAQHSPYGRKIQIGLRKNLKRRLSEWQVNRIQGKLHWGAFACSLNDWKNLVLPTFLLTQVADETISPVTEEAFHVQDRIRLFRVRIECWIWNWTVYSSWMRAKKLSSIMLSLNVSRY